MYVVTIFTETQIMLNPFLHKQQYIIRCLADYTIKLIGKPLTHGTLVRYMKGNKLIHHSSQLKEERKYRVVFTYLRDSVDMLGLRDDISQHEDAVLNIINAKTSCN